MILHTQLKKVFATHILDHTHVPLIAVLIIYRYFIFIAICRKPETLFSRPLFAPFMTKGLVRPPALSRQAVCPYGRRVGWVALPPKSNSRQVLLATTSSRFSPPACFSILICCFSQRRSTPPQRRFEVGQFLNNIFGVGWPRFSLHTSGLAMRNVSFILARGQTLSPKGLLCAWHFHLYLALSM